MALTTEQESKAAGLRRSSDHRQWIKGRIATLLSHYYRPNDDPRLVSAVADDWADVLGGYSQDAISKACRDWLIDMSRRPTPADIRKGAVSYTPKPVKVLEDISKPRITKERGDEICRLAGFRINRFGGVE